MNLGKMSARICLIPRVTQEVWKESLSSKYSSIHDVMMMNDFLRLLHGAPEHHGVVAYMELLLQLGFKGITCGSPMQTPCEPAGDIPFRLS